MFYSSDEVLFSAGAVVFDATETRVLTIAFRGRKNDVVVFPKGRVEGEESLIDAACREVEEETGVVCKLWPCGQIASVVEMKEQRPEDKWMIPTWIDVADAPNALTREDDRRLLNLCLIHKQKLADQTP
ncbi:hypothetical protein COEREDRAFT_14479 [Coemansia reversa NRRL 1564]|uniref:Nudix hydrolase domain-containing protein n=1 Tax=Coemansia reversa (strain ATCC 12441 / NRRL 1564) TaxID=763665 RepID=A0A2G5BF66_COERN|nr:hypothetical protein COEREDRAFT_14479 [Coemansia reversa NRRL 1564]|eukprot:PIA17668.1 hypothetical protein COEREDRAFT_14479 [Coemansia reversa NRRL 1564]